MREGPRDRPVTSWPWRSSSAHRREPTSPFAPVTATFMTRLAWPSRPGIEQSERQMSTSDAAIVLAGVAKHFRKSKVRREYTTLKTELLRLVKRARPAVERVEFIEALKSVDLTVPKGRTVGIIGRNGSGK